MSINRSQAQALAEGLLDNLGSDEVLQPKETYSELIILAGEFVDDAQDNLNKTQSNASGKLSESLVVNHPTIEGSTVKVDVTMNFYGQFVNSGVKGTKGGSGKYSFKNEFPSRAMIASLTASIKSAKLKTSNVNRHKTVSGNEKKNIRVSDTAKVWGAARNIKMYGIKATGFIDKAVQTTEDKISDRLGNAFKIDIINAI